MCPFPAPDMYADAEENTPPLFPVVLRVVAATVTGAMLFLFLGFAVVGWKVCCEFDTREFVERDEAVSAVVEGMGPVWPFQSIEVRANNAGDLLVERNWLGVSELRAIISNAEHERTLAEDNDLKPVFGSDAVWLFHSSYERRTGVILKSGSMAVVVAAGMYLLIRVTRARPEPPFS